jgi:hypothetical protein
MRNVVIGVFAISFGSLVGGCGDLLPRLDFPSPARSSNLDRQDENTCRSRGLAPDFQGYTECLRQLAEQRASDEAAAKASRQEGADNVQ